MKLVTCMICHKTTFYEDKVCIECHSLKPDYISGKQYLKYFKLLAKEKYK